MCVVLSTGTWCVIWDVSTGVTNSITDERLLLQLFNECCVKSKT
jgi:hypothetical protein